MIVAERLSLLSAIAFTDDDCIPRRSWLREGVEALSDGADGASGRIVVPLPREPTDYELDAAGLEGADFATANCFYRRAALEAAGGFDERFTSAWREDSDLFFTLLESGHRLVRAPAAIVVHPVRKAGWGVALRQVRKSVFEPLLYRKHRALYRRAIAPRPLWNYYLTTAALGVALGAGLTGRRRTAAAAGAAWCVLTARFCARRLRKTSRVPSHIAEMAVTSAAIPVLSLIWRAVGAIRYRAFVA